MSQNGRDYAYIGHFGNENGIHIVDITDPTVPTSVSNFKSPSGWNDFRDVQTVKRGRRAYGFFASDNGGGLVIANVTNPANPVEVYRITSLHGGADNVHTIAIDGNHLYEADARTPIIRVFDIANPANPKFLRLIVSATDSVHEVTAMNGRLYAAGISTNPLVEIFDVTQVLNLSQPINTITTVYSGGKTHTAWPTADGQFIAVPREKQGEPLSFWDISNPTNPVLAWEIALPTSQAFSAHQAMIIGDRLYASWYQAGIFVYDISNRYNPVLLGNYDTYGGTLGGYHGAWGVFPFLGDDRILGFDMQSGLYVLSLDESLPAPSISPGNRLNDVQPSVQLSGGVLRVVLGNDGHTTQLRQNTEAATIEVVVDGTALQFALADVVRLNIYGGDGDDRFILDPSITHPFFVDGGGGVNTVLDWATSRISGIDIDAHCADLTGVAGDRHFEFWNIHTFVGDEARTAAVPFAHMNHGMAFNANPSSHVAVENAKALSGFEHGAVRHDSPGMVSSIGGAIAREYATHTAVNSQVGGQVAFHKLG